MDAGDYHGRLAKHVSDFFPEAAFRELTWPHGPIGQHLPNWRVMAGQLAPLKGAWAYFTHGAWEVTQDSHAFEFFMLSSEQRDDINAELLAMITFFYGDPRSGLDVGKVLNIGKPWGENSDLDHILISLPYPFGPDFEHAVIGEKHIRYLWALPISKAEADYARQHGFEALEARLEQAAIDAGDPFRKSVVP
ncbi:MAG TPA: hypothetical protein DGG94_14185 [Micromonosporaceae bacterium]|nr:hypothetical protein [Micromonosporaceae bacterium]HCU50925.1 hypothetical protein [Micromonosporaceae bacterium]